MADIIVDLKDLNKYKSFGSVGSVNQCYTKSLIENVTGFSVAARSGVSYSSNSLVAKRDVRYKVNESGYYDCDCDTMCQCDDMCQCDGDMCDGDGGCNFYCTCNNGGDTCHDCPSYCDSNYVGGCTPVCKQNCDYSNW